MNCKSLLLASGKTLLTALLCLGSVATAEAQISITNLNPYQQNFAGLSTSWTNGSTLQGWSAFINGTGAGTGAPTTIAVSNGSDKTDGLKNYGGSLGGIHGNAFYYGVSFINNTGKVIRDFNVEYTAKQWTTFSKNNNNLQFQYKTGANLSLNTNGWKDVNALDASGNPGANKSPFTVLTPPTTQQLAALISDVELAAGQEIMFRWVSGSNNNANGDVYLSIDDVIITPINTPRVFYSQSSGNLQTKGNWGTNTNGTGTAPSSFNSSYQTFIIQNNLNATISRSWDVSGDDSKVIVGNGVSPVKFTIPNNWAFSGTIDVANNATLQIDGSVPVLGTLGNTSTVIFNGDFNDIQDIPARTYGNLTISSLTPSGSKGTKFLNGKITVNGTLNFINSDLQATETDTLFLGTNATINETTAYYFKGRMLKPVTINGAGNHTFGGMGLEFNNTTGNWGLVKVTRTTNAAIINPKDDTKESIKRSWHISPQFQAGTPVNMTFKWLASEDNGQNFPASNQAQAQAWKSTDNGVTWMPVGNLFTFDASGTERTVSLTTSSFSIWTFSGPNNPLPVSWLYFKGKATNNGNNLTWATASEKNSAAFVVERSADGKTFEVIGNVKAAGNSNQVLNYQFTDKKPLTAATAYYRLKQTDLDGAFEYSSIIAIANNDHSANVVNAYPNPFAQTLNLQLAPNHTLQKVVIMGLDGKEVYSKELTSATETVLNDLPNLKAGVYLLQLVGGNEITTLKVMRQ